MIEEVEEEEVEEEEGFLIRILCYLPESCSLSEWWLTVVISGAVEVRAAAVEVKVAAAHVTHDAIHSVNGVIIHACNVNKSNQTTVKIDWVLERAIFAVSYSRRTYIKQTESICNVNSVCFYHTAGC